MARIIDFKSKKVVYEEPKLTEVDKVIDLNKFSLEKILIQTKYAHSLMKTPFRSREDLDNSLNYFKKLKSINIDEKYCKDSELNVILEQLEFHIYLDNNIGKEGSYE